MGRGWRGGESYGGEERRIYNSIKSVIKLKIKNKHTKMAVLLFQGIAEKNLLKIISSVLFEQDLINYKLIGSVILHFINYLEKYQF